MALTGLEIFKLFPRTNCGECGVPTCLAFAMKLAQKKAELGECPYASDEAKSILSAASEPPMRTLKIGFGADAFEIGGETEMFRHSKTFYHQTALAIQIDDRLNPDEIEALVAKIGAFSVDRVGEKLTLDAFCLSNLSQDRDKFLRALKLIIDNSSKPVILHTKDLNLAQECLNLLSGKRPVIFPQNQDPTSFVELAQKSSANLVISAANFAKLADLVENISTAGFRDLILHLDHQSSGEYLQTRSIIRRAALRRNFKPFGYPQITWIKAQSVPQILAEAVVAICKYSAILILPKFSPELLLTLFTLRQNIYTDPQKPIQVDPKIAAIGEPDPHSPVFLTTNFSLTYFIVSSEIENAGISAWLVIPDCEGMSVLTAWAAGKFSPEKIAKFVQQVKLEEHIATREMVIPGYVASISGELEEKLKGWKIVVGPQEAADLAPFIKNYLQK